MRIYKIQKVEKYKKRPKSHTGKMEGAYTAPCGSGKIDIRLTPVHRYTLEEKEKPVNYNKEISYFLTGQFLHSSPVHTPSNLKQLHSIIIRFGSLHVFYNWSRTLSISSGVA